MNVLLLAPYPPYPPHGGGRQRIFQLVRRLAPRHRLHVLTFTPSPAATAALEPLRELCAVTTVPVPVRTPARRLVTTLSSSLPDMIWRGRSPAFAARLAELLNSFEWDVVQAESIEMTQYAPARRQSTDNRRSLWIYDSFNVEYMIQQRAFYADLRQPGRLPLAVYSWLQWRKLRQYEQRLAEWWDGAFAVSPADQDQLRQLAPRLATAVIPNGVDTSYFTPRRSDGPSGQTCLFTGTLDYRPNIDALHWFCAEVWPSVRQRLPEARLLVVGRNPQPVQALERHPGVTIVGEVEDVRPYFSQAQVYVVPMRVGGGARLKVLEAFAQALPVVSTSVGLEGITGVRSNVHAFVADDGPAFATIIIQVLTDPELGRQVGAASRLFVEERYDWNVIVPGVEAAWTGWRDHRTLA